MSRKSLQQRHFGLSNLITTASVPISVLILTLWTARTAATETAPLPNRPLDLKEAVQVARTRGLDLLLADAATQGAQADERSAGAIPNPAISATYGRSLYYNRAQTDYEAQNPGSSNVYTVGLTDQAAIVDSLSGKRGLRRDVAHAAVQAAKMGRIDAERVLVAAVKSQYFQMALSEQVLDFVKETQKSTVETRDLVKTRFRLGSVSEADVARSESAKLEADQAVDAAYGDLLLQQANMAFLLGVRGTVPNYDVESHVLDYRELPVLAQYTSSGLLQTAQHNRPDLKAAEYQEQQARASLDLARRQRFPDIALSVAYTQIGNGQNNEQPSSLSFGLSAPLPIFYQNQGEIAKANASIQSQIIQRAKLNAQISSDVAATWAAFTTARRRVIRMQGELLHQVDYAQKLVAIQYEKGAATLLELLDARRTFISVNLEYRQDLSDYWTSAVRLEQTLGIELFQ
jgi:cobalt-zinc-cadmium efflux system outer membrane protein